MDLRRLFAAVGGLAVAVSSQIAVPADATTVVRTTAGLVRGTVADDHREYLGIPYAAPPVGPLRWRSPRPAPHWPGVRDATRPGPSCPQFAPDGSGVTGQEDCLNLNVWAPARVGSRLPVVVWIPGGGFVTGAGSQYDPTRLVTQGGVVVVTLNYRLGALGFLRSPALAAEDRAAGTYGLADQQAALRWIRRDIAAFGGDPHNVTVAGQSAGGFSVCAHLAAPASRGLFDKAVAQSGPCGNPLVTRPEAERRGTDAAAALGCAPGDLACLRSKPAADLVRLGADKVFTDTAPISALPWLPVAGTALLPEQPIAAIQDGTAARVPFVHGGTRDEMSIFVALNHGTERPLTADQYAAAVQELFGSDGAAVLRRYPVGRYPSPGEALYRVLSDWGGKLGSCSMLPADDGMARSGPVYAYEFAEDSGPVHGMPFPLGAPHGSDTQYLFDGTFSPTHPHTPEQRALARSMVAYLAHFAATGDPNGPGLPRWPAYRHGTVLSLAGGPDGIAPTDLDREHQCGFWRTVLR
ncbi:carboxylesterase/lipase family protein [Kribbella sp. GL6]|uniref:carboxylesterase/lipase family protein n=1 Tax=Kribbella sp. GL6 TaxID=3419765 RepID=UPI003D012222